eukprot:scaffold373106_cov38-Prasinocladus_malaysianus.AAC.1
MHENTRVPGTEADDAATRVLQSYRLLNPQRTYSNSSLANFADGIAESRSSVSTRQLSSAALTR